MVDFQRAKQEYKTTAKAPLGFKQEDLDRGFITSGLWGYSRHPNFAAEQSIWFLLYQWSCFASKQLYSWLAVGPVFLLMLFQGSTWLTELITAGKYPEYNDYRRGVGMFVPTSTSAYKTPVVKPKVIRASELAKKQKQK
jgi:steroid 5-alpha reductase family enzyme